MNPARAIFGFSSRSAAILAAADSHREDGARCQQRAAPARSSTIFYSGSIGQKKYHFPCYAAAARMAALRSRVTSATKHRGNLAFTLIELLVVISIIALLAG